MIDVPVADAVSELRFELCECFQCHPDALPPPGGGTNQFGSSAVRIGHNLDQALSFETPDELVNRLPADSETTGQVRLPCAGKGQVGEQVPRMGGEVHMKVDADVAAGRIDLYLAPLGAGYGPPLPVRVIPNGDGVDVFFTLARFHGQSDVEWEEALASMARELEGLKTRHER